MLVLPSFPLHPIFLWNSSFRKPLQQYTTSLSFYLNYLICDWLFAQRHYLVFPTFKYLRKCAITFVCIVLKLFKSHIKDLALVDAKSFK